MSWLILIALVVLAAIFILTPLHVIRDDDFDERDSELEDVRRQLVDLEGSDAKTERLEGVPKGIQFALERRALSLLDRDRSNPIGNKTLLSGVMAAILFSSTAGLYALLGAPDFESRAVKAADIERMQIVAAVERLSEELSQNPSDIEGWTNLLQARVLLGQKEIAQADFSRALSLLAGEPELLRELRSIGLSLSLSTN